MEGGNSGLSGCGLGLRSGLGFLKLTVRVGWAYVWVRVRLTVRVRVHVHSRPRAYVHVYRGAYVHTSTEASSTSYIHACMHACMHTNQHGGLEHIASGGDGSSLLGELCRYGGEAKALTKLRDPRVVLWVRVRVKVKSEG